MPVVMLTTSDDERDLIVSLQAGVRGYLFKDMEPDELIVALEGVVAGQTVVAKELTGILAEAVRGDAANLAPKPAFSELTPRER